jgi:hypothetical protein
MLHSGMALQGKGLFEEAVYGLSNGFVSDAGFPGIRMDKFVVISTDRNELYSFFSPIVCLMWRNLIGYIPISILYENEQVWNAEEKSKFVLHELRKFSAVEFVESVPDIKGSTVAQVSRLYAASLEDVPADSYILTSDVDMFPLQRNWFHQQDKSKRFHLFGADANLPTILFPICYLGGNVETWREIMEINETGLQDNLLHHLNPLEDSWNYDERLFAEKITRWKGFPHECMLIMRGWINGLAIGRMDRAIWDFNGHVTDITGLIDSHSLRPGFIENNWNRIAFLLSRFCSREDLLYILNYREQYIKL